MWGFEDGDGGYGLDGHGDAEEETRVRASMMGCSSLGRPPRRVYDCGLAPRQQQQNHRDCAGGRRRVWR